MDKRKFYIDWETADRITIDNLIEAYNYTKRESIEIQQLDEIPDHKASDLAYDFSLLRALKIVIKHYGEDVN